MTTRDTAELQIEVPEDVRAELVAEQTVALPIDVPADVLAELDAEERAHELFAGDPDAELAELDGESG